VGTHVLRTGGSQAKPEYKQAKKTQMGGKKWRGVGPGGCKRNLGGEKVVGL